MFVICDVSLVHKNDKEADKQERKLLINSCKTVADNGVSCPNFATNRTDLPTLIFFLVLFKEAYPDVHCPGLLFPKLFPQNETGKRS